MKLQSWLPRGLGGRIGVILIGIILVIQLLALGLFLRSEARDSARLLDFSLGIRMAAALRLIESRSFEERLPIVFAVNSPTLGMAVFEAPPFEDAQRERGIRRLRRLVDHPRSPFHDREVRLRIVEDDASPLRSRHHRFRERTDPSVPMQPPDLLPSQRKIEIATILADGSWAVFRLPGEATSLGWAVRMVLWISLSFVALSVLGYLAVRRMARPLRQLARHAEELGTSLDTPPMRESGPSEVMAAARAFNLMQERLKRYIDDRTRMLGALSHDLRTIITRLRLRAEFIEEEEQRAKAVRDLGDMLVMLQSSLDFARDDAKREPMAATDLAALVRTALDDFSDQGHQVTYQGPDHRTVRCRPVAIRRAFDNLIDNAVAYGGAADVTLSAEQGQAIVTIGDRGPGIPEAERRRVFDPFYRLEASRSRDTGGSGLGLAVAHAVITGHGGAIALEDRAGGGLLVRVSLPATP